MSGRQFCCFGKPTDGPSNGMYTELTTNLVKTRATIEIVTSPETGLNDNSKECVGPQTGENGGSEGGGGNWRVGQWTLPLDRHSRRNTGHREECNRIYNACPACSDLETQCVDPQVRIRSGYRSIASKAQRRYLLGHSVVRYVPGSCTGRLGAPKDAPPQGAMWVRVSLLGELRVGTKCSA